MTMHDEQARKAEPFTRPFLVTNDRPGAWWKIVDQDGETIVAPIFYKREDATQLCDRLNAAFPTQPTDQREAFEAWARSNTIGTPQSPNYGLASLAWQAALTHAAPSQTTEKAELTDAEASVIDHCRDLLVKPKPVPRRYVSELLAIISRRTGSPS